MPPKAAAWSNRSSSDPSVVAWPFTSSSTNGFLTGGASSVSGTSYWRRGSMMTACLLDISITSGSELGNSGGSEAVACSRSLVWEPGSDSGTSSDGCLALAAMPPRSMRGIVASSGFLGRMGVRSERRDMGRGRGIVTNRIKIFYLEFRPHPQPYGYCTKPGKRV